MEEIVVTARKRSETAQSIPESIKPVSSHDLERLGADSLADFAGVIPGLQLTGTRAATQIVLRGVTTGPVNHDQTEIKETVGLYLDETPIAVQRFNPNVKLFDLDRIEVLRGPQGTLYGAGSMSGAIRMITRKPQAQSFEAATEISGESVSNGGIGYTLDGMVNLPLVSDVLAVRAVASYRDNPGYIDNVVLNQKDVNSEETSTGRIQVRYTPNSRFSLDAMVFAQRSKFAASSAYAAEAGVLKTNVTQNEPVSDRILIGSLTASYGFDNVDLTVVGSALRKRNTYFIEDGSFTNFITGFRDGLGGTFANISNQDNYSLEARLSSKPDVRVNWIVGVFTQTLKNVYGQDFTVPGVDRVSGIDSRTYGAAVDQLYWSHIDVREDQAALFGEASTDLVKNLTLTVGGRLFWSKQTAEIDFRGIFADPNIGLFQFKNSEHGFNPKVNLSYKFDADHLVYVQAAKGFRLGGTNEPVPLTTCGADLVARGLNGAPQGFKSDTLWNYEVGAKTSWFDRRLTVNGSIYRIDWKDPQVTAQLPCGFNVYVNAGGLKIYGAELETIMRPLEGMTLSAGAGYTDSTLVGPLKFVSGQDGDHAPYTPKWTFNATAEYTRRLTQNLSGFVYLNYQYTGSRTTRFNSTASNYYRLPSYGVFNGRVGVQKDNWSVELFGENLTDERGEINKSFNPYPINAATQVTVIQPRTIGVKLRMHY